MSSLSDTVKSLAANLVSATDVFLGASQGFEIRQDALLDLDQQIVARVLAGREMMIHALRGNNFTLAQLGAAEVDLALAESLENAITHFLVTGPGQSGDTQVWVG